MSKLKKAGVAAGIITGCAWAATGTIIAVRRRSVFNVFISLRLCLVDKICEIPGYSLLTVGAVKPFSVDHEQG